MFAECTITEKKPVKKGFSPNDLSVSVNRFSCRSRQKNSVNGIFPSTLPFLFLLNFRIRSHQHTEFENAVFSPYRHGTLMFFCNVLNGTKAESMAAACFCRMKQAILFRLSISFLGIFYLQYNKPAAQIAFQ